MKNLLLKFFKPTVYVVIKDQFLGDFVHRVPIYKFLNQDTITFKIDTDDYLYPLEQVFLTEKAAKKLAQKTILPLTFPEEHVKLLSEIEAKGISLSEGARQQILEDGEASEIYQELKKN